MTVVGSPWSIVDTSRFMWPHFSDDWGVTGFLRAWATDFSSPVTREEILEMAEEDFEDRPPWLAEIGMQ